MKVRRAVISFGFCLVACGDSADAPARDQSAPPATPVQGPILDSVGSLTLAHEFTIGALDGDPEYAFGQIEAVAARDDGGFYLCDRNDMQIREYNRAGRFLQRVGRRGAGPSEYEYCGLLIVHADTLMVSDISNGRLVFFPFSGSRSRVSAWPPAYGASAIDDSGRIWVKAERAPRDADERAGRKALVYGRDGEPRDSFDLPSVRRPRGTHALVLSTEDGLLNPQFDSLFALLEGGGIAVASADRYRIEIRGRAGRTVFERDVAAPSYAAAEREEWNRRLEAERRQPQLPLPNRKPFLRELRGDDVGRLWVKLADTAYRRSSDAPLPLTHGEQGVWDLFDRTEGDYIGQIRLPLGHELVISRGDRVWLRSTADDGSLRLSVFQIRPAAPER